MRHSLMNCNGQVLSPRSANKMNEVYNGRPALFDMFNILVCPTEDTERLIIRQQPEWRLPSFINLYNSLADLSIFRCPVESAL